MPLEIGGPEVAGAYRHRPPAKEQRKRGSLACARMKRASFVALAVLAGLFLLAVAERVLYSGDVMPDVEVAGISLGGQSESDAYRELSGLAARLESEPMSVRAGDERLAFAPGEIGYEVDEAATLRAARETARTANPFAQMKSFVTRLFGTESAPLVVSWDERRLDALIEHWRVQLSHGVQEGDLRFEGATVIEVAPHAGRGIDPHEAGDRVKAALRSSDRAPVELSVRRVQPKVRQADVSSAARRARALLRTSKLVVASWLTPPPTSSVNPW